MNRKSSFRPTSRVSVRSTVMVKYTAASFLLAAIASVILLIFLNVGSPNRMKAESPTTMITSWDFESAISTPIEGVAWDSISSTALLKTYSGGMGISPGPSPNNQGVSMVFDKSNFNVEGIDFSLKYRYYDQNAVFLQRGDCMRFEIVNKKLNIKYRTSTTGTSFVNTISNNIYSLANGDVNWHTYRFVYDPNYAQGMVMVDNDTVWTKLEASGSKLYFGNCTQNVTVAQFVTASGANIPVLDNLSMKGIPYQALPVEYDYVQARPENAGVQFEWKTFTEKNMSGFEVQRSLDSRTFRSIESVPSLGADGTGTDYAIFDPAPESGMNYYRLKSIDLDGSVGFSNIVAVEILTNENAVQEAIRQFVVYPNPVPAGMPVQLQIEASVSGDAHIELYDLGGKRMMAEDKTVSTGMNQNTVSVGSKLTPGVYIFNVELNGEKKSTRLVIQ